MKAKEHNAYWIFDYPAWRDWLTWWALVCLVAAFSNTIRDYSGHEPAQDGSSDAGTSHRYDGYVPL